MAVTLYTHRDGVCVCVCGVWVCVPVQVMSELHWSDDEDVYSAGQGVVSGVNQCSLL